MLHTRAATHRPVARGSWVASSFLSPLSSFFPPASRVVMLCTPSHRMVNMRSCGISSSSHSSLSPSAPFPLTTAPAHAARQMRLFLQPPSSIFSSSCRFLFGKAAKAPASSEKQHFDLLIIGGGSGGLAASKVAAECGKKVAVLDYVTPSSHGAQWGLGGTCVNVGCIPKKLMHRAAIIGETVQDAPFYGYTIPSPPPSSTLTSSLVEHTPLPAHSWAALVEKVQEHIKSLNFGYRGRLTRDQIKYFNVKGSFLDENTVECVDGRGNKTVLTADAIIIAVGGRPKPLDIPGGDLAIDSDDLFALKDQKPPGKTLVIGASYVALECAGFLNALGYDTTIMQRSIWLRGFDQDMAGRVVNYMTAHGTKVLTRAVPVRIDKLPSGQLKVQFKQSNAATGEAVIGEDVFDTVLTAIGRDPLTTPLRLHNAGIKTHEKSGKILTDAYERVVNGKKGRIYAIGDVAHNRPELTPSAIMAGRMLSKRLFARAGSPAAVGNDEGAVMNYNCVATTVFTPLEYSCVGLSEDDAIAMAAQQGAEVEVYHSNFKPLEWALPKREDNACYMKIVAIKDAVVGIHYLGPNAGEVMQGFAVAMQCGVTVNQLKNTVGIHPTTAEELLDLHITKRSGESPLKSGC